MEDSGIEFDWDPENSRHLERHRVTPAEFEELILGDPLYLEYQTENGEERFKVLGVTEAGRILIGVFTLRAGKIRAITAYRAGAPYRKLFLENQL